MDKKSGSQWTRRWREMDSNHRSPVDTLGDTDNFRCLDQINCCAGAAQVGSPTYASFARLLQESNMTRLHDSLTVIDGLVISKWSRAVIPTSYMKLKAREPSSLTGQTT
jgi:hypothetical protein